MEGIQALMRGLTEASASLFYHLLVGLALEGLLLMAIDLGAGPAGAGSRIA
jgi:phosphoribosyl-ATP pyrophosphohydrolase